MSCFWIVALPVCLGSCKHRNTSCTFGALNITRFDLDLRRALWVWSTFIFPNSVCVAFSTPSAWRPRVTSILFARKPRSRYCISSSSLDTWFFNYGFLLFFWRELNAKTKKPFDILIFRHFSLCLKDIDLLDQEYLKVMKSSSCSFPFWHHRLSILKSVQRKL